MLDTYNLKAVTMGSTSFNVPDFEKDPHLYVKCTLYTLPRKLGANIYLSEKDIFFKECHDEHFGTLKDHEPLCRLEVKINVKSLPNLPFASMTSLPKKDGAFVVEILVCRLNYFPLIYESLELSGQSSWRRLRQKGLLNLCVLGDVTLHFKHQATREVNTFGGQVSPENRLLQSYIQKEAPLYLYPFYRRIDDGRWIHVFHPNA